MNLLGAVRAMIPAWLAALLSSPTTFPGRSIGWGTSSKLLAMHHAVERRRYSKYPEAVSIDKTERFKRHKRLLREGKAIRRKLEREFRDFPGFASEYGA